MNRLEETFLHVNISVESGVWHVTERRPYPALLACQVPAPEASSPSTRASLSQPDFAPPFPLPRTHGLDSLPFTGVSAHTQPCSCDVLLCPVLFSHSIYSHRKLVFVCLPACLLSGFAPESDPCEGQVSPATCPISPGPRSGACGTQWVLHYCVHMNE